MKKNFLSVAFAMLTFSVFAQNPFLGIWEGKVHAAVDLRVTFTLQQDENKKFGVIMDLPDQGLKVESKDVLINKDSVVINIKEFQGSYYGKIINDSTISGHWKQGITTVLPLKKVMKVKTIQRPQTPVPPFPYKSEDIVYTNSDGAIQYGATITIPFGKGPFPTVILITGSGQQNRDEEIIGHKPFAVMADFLTKNGFVVLRVDDRGVGQTTGEVMTANTLDFCDDVSAGLDYLISRKEVNKKRLGLIGHSEGGMIAPILASKRKDIHAIVLLAAPGKNGSEILIEQNQAHFTSIGLPETYVSSYMELYSSIIHTMKNSTDKETTEREVTATVDNWLKATPKHIAATTTGIVNDEKRNVFINSMIEVFGSSWFQYFINYEPEIYIEKLTCKVLALNGDKDIQISSKSNLAGIEAALKKNKSKGYQLKEYENLNHLFQHCNTCTIKEYGEIDETISTDVLKDIAAWLRKEM